MKDLEWNCAEDQDPPKKIHYRSVQWVKLNDRPVNTEQASRENTVTLLEELTDAYHHILKPQRVHVH
jgi:hypothetical protein